MYVTPYDFPIISHQGYHDNKHRTLLLLAFFFSFVFVFFFFLRSSHPSLFIGVAPSLYAPVSYYPLISLSISPMLLFLCLVAQSRVYFSTHVESQAFQLLSSTLMNGLSSTKSDDYYEQCYWLLEKAFLKLTPSMFARVLPRKHKAPSRNPSWNKQTLHYPNDPSKRTRLGFSFPE